ncbi:MAG: DUF2069 domain-containing protein [Motiliproteus sp.]
MNSSATEKIDSNTARQLAQKANIMRQITRLLLLALITSISLWTLLLAPPPTANPITIWLIQVVPLALFLPGIFKGNPRVHIWLCFVITVYFCSGVIHSMSPLYPWMGISQSLFTAALFSTAMMYVRWNGLARKAGNEG